MRNLLSNSIDRSSGFREGGDGNWSCESEFRGLVVGYDRINEQFGVLILERSYSQPEGPDACSRVGHMMICDQYWKIDDSSGKFRLDDYLSYHELILV